MNNIITPAASRVESASFLQRYFRLMTPAAAAALGIFLITALALFTPPYVGMADNGDYFRVAYGNGLYFNDPEYGKQYFGYYVKQYGIFQYFNENPSMIMTSQSLFIQISVWLNKLLFSTQVFDLRIQALLYLTLYTAAVYVLVEAATWRLERIRGYLIAALAVFIFGDTAYTAYFSSFYSESVVLIMMVFLLASGLLLYRGRYNDYAMIALFGTSGFLLTTSKQQHAPVGLLIAAVGVLFLMLRREWRFRAVTAAILVTVMAAGVASYVLIPQEYVYINQYHAMMRGVLKDSPDPEKTLESFGIDKQYALLNKSIYYEPYPTIEADDPLLQKSFYPKYGFVSIALYYVKNPGQAVQMLNFAAKNAFTIRPEAMGNYERFAGKPAGTKTFFFSGYSIFKKALSPKTAGFIVIWVILIIGLYAPHFVSSYLRRDWRQLLRLPLMGLLILMGLSGIAVSVIGAGDADLAKHEFMFTAAFDLVLFVTLTDAIGRRLWAERETKARRRGMS
ncbi:glycan biosynthesis hexose transferase WsfD [Paenibacillus gansuensis]|uniref:Transmembrane protein n=1 Tax=Paenibacillus gansuensis TaxID=306542 RepID=A0ABW5PG34_9BACL